MKRVHSFLLTAIAAVGLVLGIAAPASAATAAPRDVTAALSGTCAVVIDREQMWVSVTCDYVDDNVVGHIEFEGSVSEDGLADVAGTSTATLPYGDVSSAFTGTYHTETGVYHIEGVIRGPWGETPFEYDGTIDPRTGEMTGRSV
jgi:hypothetical protein